MSFYKSSSGTPLFENEIARAHAVEPRFNEPLNNEVLGITNDILQPGQSYRKRYETKP